MANSLVQVYDPHWRKILVKYVSAKQYQKAITVLDKILGNEMPLFRDDPTIISERRIALLLKIEILRKIKKDLEALAWLCLECELDPDNNLAQLLKDQFKYKLNLHTISENNSKVDDKYKFIEDPEWPEVAGMDELKLSINNFVIKPINNSKYYKGYKIEPPSGIIFYGPQGCGKTFFARKIADKIKYHFIEVKPSDLASTFVHGTQEKILELFKVARQKAPTLIFFDEFDAMVPKRENTSHHYKSEVNEFLVQLDNLKDSKILVVAATNRIKEIDKAILRPGRIDLKFFVPPPDLEARIETLKMYLKGRPIKTIDWVQIGEYTSNYTYAELKNIVELSVINAANNREKVSTNHLTDTILANPASLKEKDIDKMKLEALE